MRPLEGAVLEKPRALVRFCALVACMGSLATVPATAQRFSTQEHRVVQATTEQIRTAPQLALSATPVAVIGEDPTSEVTTLHRIRGLALFDDAVVVGDGSTRQLKKFSLRGDAEPVVVGGRGGGPEEYGSLDEVHRLGDRVVATDVTRGRVLRYDRDLALREEARVAPAIVGAQITMSTGTRRLLPRLGLDGGRVIAYYVPTEAPYEFRVGETVIARRTHVLVLVNRAREGAQEIAGSVGEGWAHFQRRPRGLTIFEAPFRPDMRLAVHGTTLFLADSTSGKISVYDLEDEPRIRVEWVLDLAPRPVTRADRRAWIESKPLPEMTRQMLEGLEGGEDAYFPELHPMIEDLFVDAEGTLWVQVEHRDRPESRNEWVLIDEARVVGRVQVDERFRLEDATREMVAGVWTDEYEVESVRVYRIGRGG